MTLISDEFETLTKDQQYILSVLYKDYLECVKSGSVKLTCNNFDSAQDIHLKYFQKLHFEDVENDLKKLKKYEFLNGIFADNTIYQVVISDKTIVYFENQFKNNLKSIIDSISKIASVIPGL
ncbi:hypothetical protein ACB385_001140 [Staphylococcus pseudintermedius]|uniref:hypothetical protein n=1 Tax=Staphylococcus pseudintermedius TaxID=283734 RepID=UPI00090A9FD6|nr:hypothetical protein [Staphylococcus pseudintermedius]APD19959.1 hypothetical protein SpT99F3_010 [Staphylococcus phage SpT99F3]EGQ2677771.1 hypothetical protein [Staphylococcus pseudintermedius]EGQ3613210.1 hypothetical protein [Staphylococcus pseudintermedius]EGQ3840973.1 hypothetical protein [Staphylococcus pseudintermedius]EHT3665245.1 hypothetical protein [Staphylococcus pseudintermedius]